MAKKNRNRSDKNETRKDQRVSSFQGLKVGENGELSQREESLKQESNVEEEDEKNIRTAPYNFIPLTHKVVHYPGECPKHNDKSKETLSGEIVYQVRAETPIIVDSGDGTFYKRQDGYAIPGSTMRGLVRTNAQVLSFSAVGGDIQNYAFMYRDVANTKESREEVYRDILGVELRNGQTVLKNVKAGYITKCGKDYSICPAMEDGHYYTQNERHIIEEALDLYEQDKKSNFEDILEDFQNDMERFSKEEKCSKSIKVIHYKGKERKGFQPHARKIQYQVNQKGQVIAVKNDGEPLEEGFQRGTLFFSGHMREKKAFYIIPEKDANAPRIEISQEDVTSYQIDFNNKKDKVKRFFGNSEEKAEKFLGLPKEGEMKPIFYVEKEGRIYFGCTPRMRVFYKNSIFDGIPEEHRTMEGLDYVQALFGTARKGNSQKSRLSFLDAKATNAELDTERSVVLMEPRASSCMDYIQQSNPNRTTSYNDDFKINGIKQYWLHKEIVLDPLENRSISSTFTPLKAGAMFEGRVRFFHLTQEELGLVCWALALNENSRQNIGKAKAYGYGRAEIQITDLKIWDYDKMYSGNGLDWSPYAETQDVKKTVDEYIEKYCAKMAELTGSSDWVNRANISALFSMKHEMLRKELIGYMSMKEYKEKKIHKTVKQMVKYQSLH